MINQKKRPRQIAIVAASVLLVILGLLVIIAEFYVGPALRKRLQLLIVDGSDSLYTYKLGSLNASLLGGSVELSDLVINIDSERYNLLKSQNDLPALVMQLNVHQARIRGINIFALLFSKKIFISEISSSKADVKLYRYPKKEDTVVGTIKQPLWKAVQSKIKDVQVDKIKLDGIKLLYKNEEESEAKLQFDRCDALFENIRIDSASIADTSRIGYVENFYFRLNGLKYRTPDSTYKMKADRITYNSAQRLLSIDSFKLQPTLKKEERTDSLRKSWYTLTFDKVYFQGLRLDRYLRLNRAEADSAVVQSARLSIYQDKTALKSYKSQIGSYPHQKLMEMKALINMKKFIGHNMQVEILEKQEDTGQEGRIDLSDLEVTVANIVNDPKLISKNPVTTAEARGKIIGSPIHASFRFYLDSADGKFDVKGSLKNVTAVQINPISTTLANVQIPSAQIDDLNFFVRGEDFGATADVQMKYSNLSVVFLKRDKETGANSTRKFLTDLLNKYAIYTSNPASGAERKAYGVKVA
ncbi:MAG: hypothetical protein M3Y85_00450, partial [Bacteroidota bacterium]|nr:hypothetical protein [Bacteroidota bacterium]